MSKEVWSVKSQGGSDSFGERQFGNWDRGMDAISDGYVSRRDWGNVTLFFTRWPLMILFCHVTSFGDCRIFPWLRFPINKIAAIF